MARETKAEKVLREARAAADLQLEEDDKYPGKLMAALEFASREGWDIKVRDGNFLVRSDEDRDTVYALSYKREPLSHDLCFLEGEVERVLAKKAEAQRKQDLRNSAREKLTDEERKAVGL